MAASAVVLAGALLLVGVPGIVLVALTPGLLCLGMGFATRPGDRHDGKRRAGRHLGRVPASSTVTD